MKILLVEYRNGCCKLGLLDSHHTHVTYESEDYSFVDNEGEWDINHTFDSRSDALKFVEEIKKNHQDKIIDKIETIEIKEDKENDFFDFGLKNQKNKEEWLELCNKRLREDVWARVEEREALRQENKRLSEENKLLTEQIDEKNEIIDILNENNRKLCSRIEYLNRKINVLDDDVSKLTHDNLNFKYENDYLKDKAMKVMKFKVYEAPCTTASCIKEFKTLEELVKFLKNQQKILRISCDCDDDGFMKIFL